MNALQEAQNNLDVVNFQIDQYEIRGDEVPSTLLTQRAFYQGEAELLQVQPATFASVAQEIAETQQRRKAAGAFGSWRTYQRPVCEISEEEAASLNTLYSGVEA